MAAKASAAEIIAAYKELGSVWTVAKRFGMCGQSVWERLRVLGYRMANTRWTNAELAELLLAGNCTISEIANRLGRPYAGVAGKISALGLKSNYGNRGGHKSRRATGYTKQQATQWTRQVPLYRGSLWAFARERSLDLELMVKSLQRHEPAFWEEYVRTHAKLPKTTCPYCQREFYPMTAKQKTCSRKCSLDMKRDADYFGGKRRETVGLAEGVCQLCLKQTERLSKRSSAHD
jgi:hypothetical protein